MLCWLHVENLALIHSLDLQFSAGLSVITGETGSGKSILVQAISALLGESVHSQTVQTGYRSASVEAEFDGVSDLIKSNKIQALGIEFDSSNRLILRREILQSGRSRYLLNDQAIKKHEFQWIGRSLLDVNSQHSHQNLLKSKYHLGLLDSALPEQDLLLKLGVVHQDWFECAERYQTLKKEMDDRNRRKQLIEYQLEEINSAMIKPGEKESLVIERERLRYAEEIEQNLQSAWNLLENENSGLCDDTARVAGLLERAAMKDTQLENLYQQAETASVMIRDLSQELQVALEAIEISPEKLEEVSERLHVLQQLEGKFQNDIDGIIQYRDEIITELLHFDSSRETLIETEKLWFKHRDKYLKINSELSGYRRKESAKTCREIERGLKMLGMSHARFDVSFAEPYHVDLSTPGKIPEKYSPFGTDDVEFLLSANPGIPLKPLTDIASGGELSRIMLALKQHLGEKIRSQTSIFDEVDSGIGGDVANAVARQLRLLSEKKQVICVTHLPQIAVRGHHHYLVEKSVDSDMTAVSVSEITTDHRVQEIARMLSGEQANSEALAHARSMLESGTTLETVDI